MKLEEEMYRLVEDYQNSGKTQKEYSRQVGIGYAKFNYWVCKYRSYGRIVRLFLTG
jgi:transposase-like protein